MIRAVLPVWLERGIAVAALAALAAGCGAAKPALRVEPKEALWDVPVEIHVTGAKPHAAVELDTRSVDENGVAYGYGRSVRADAHGRIDLRGDDAMRFLWKLAPLDPTSQYLLIPPNLQERVTLTARVGRTPLHATMLRDVEAPDIRATSLRPSKDGVFGELFTPKHPRRTGVLVFGGSEGGLSTVGTAALLASHGYPTLALAYFAEPGLPEALHDVPIEYFGRALHVLEQRTGAKRLVVYGISRGSEAAQLAGIHYPGLVRGVIALVPSNGGVCGIPRYTGQPVSCIGPAWTWRGKPVPYQDYASAETSAPFPDERIDGPVFLDCGVLDELWPSCPMAQAIVARLHARGFRHRVTLLQYERGGHAVGSLYPYAAAGGGPIGGAFPDANQAARADGWPRLLRFLGSL